MSDDFTKFDRQLWASAFGTITSVGVGVLAYLEVIPAWAFVLCFFLAAFLIFPKRVKTFITESVEWIKSWRD